MTIARKIKVMNIARKGILLVCILFSIGLVSCSRKSKIGTIRCNASKTFSISTKIPSKNWLSRHIYFDSNHHGGDPMPIYEASISSVIKNTGSQHFRITAHWAKLDNEIVWPGASIVLPEQKFKDYRIIVVPGERYASVDFEFNLDREITTESTWNLIAAWSDGP